MKIRGQTAIEFLSNYSLVILILTVAIAFVLILANAPAAIFPSQCGAYGGFTCADVVYSFNGPNGGSQLLVEITDTQPGVLNISSFSAKISHVQNSAGYCTPPVAMQGEKVYCTANVPYTPTLGSVYAGSFNISANYCSSGVGQTAVACPANGNFVYGAGIEVQAGKQQIFTGPYYYLPVTITNPTNSPAHAGLQLQINLTANSISYAQYERSDLGNIRFYDGAQSLYSWCESGCTNTSSKAMFWVKTDRPITANTAIALQIYFLPKNIDYSGRYAGEAPQLSGTYGQYDNGADVFTNYWNFAGNALPNGFWYAASATVSVNNGITVSGSPAILGINDQLNPSGAIFDIYYTSTSVTALETGIGYGTSSSSSDIQYAMTSVIYGSSSGIYYWVPTGAYTELTTISAPAIPNVIGIGWSPAPKQIFLADDSGISTASSNALSYSSANQILTRNGGGGTYTARWFRVRAYPPDGILPSFSFNSVAVV